MSLYQKHRPSDFDKVVGNEEIIESLQQMLSDMDSCPHTFLFTGQKGCGKTTIGRILAEKLGATGVDFVEVNSSQFRGIDTVRDIIKQSNFKPLNGDAKVWLIDECFEKNTPVLLKTGQSLPIKDIKIGMEIINIAGYGKVEDIFINKIPLDRIVKITLTNNKTIFCSSDHLFYTPKGWIKAIDLKNNFVFCPYTSKFVNDINSQNTLKNEKKNNTILQVLWESISETTENILQQFLQSKSLCTTGTYGNTNLSYMQNSFPSQTIFSEYNLFKKMWKYFRGDQSKWKENYERTTFENVKKSKSFFTNETRGDNKKTTSEANADKKSIVQSNKFGEGKANEKIKRNTSYLERGTWWKWKIYKTTNIIGNCFRMENGTSDKNESFAIRWFWISNLLQGRFSKQTIKDSNRSRWKITSFENKQIKRFEKNEQVGRVRVESVEIYQRGNNDQSFQGVITDTERNQGFVELYDLQIQGHPSYVANNVFVHNCHKITNDGQNAFLKILEEPPKHIYFIICTTDPQKLIEPLKDRCTTFAVKPLNEIQTTKLIKRIAKREKVVLEDKIIEQIYDSSQGHPRAAIQILEKVLSVPENKRLKAAKTIADDQLQVIELCRALFKQASWKEVSFILKALKDEEPESLRRLVLSYFQTILLKEENDHAAAIMEVFSENFYNTGFPGLVLACYTVIKGE